MQTRSNKAILAMEVFIGVIVLASIAFFAFGGFYLTVLRPDNAPIAEGKAQMQQLRDSVAHASEQQYGLIAKTGTPSEICRAATGVAEDYHHADREDRYAEWNALARQRCAGLPSP